MTEEPMKSADPLIAAHAVGMTFDRGEPVLAGIDCTIPRGQFIALLGPSGCGKSTLLRLIAGLMTPTSGTLTVAGQAPEQARQSFLRMAFVFQDPNLLPWRSVEGNVALPLELGQVPRDEQRRAVAGILPLLGLTAADARKRPASLSGGMRMRTSLARALVTNPDLLLLDEPFAALDDVLRQQLNEELVRLWRDRRWTGVFVTHNVAEAVFLAQRVLVLGARPGRIVADVEIPFDAQREPALRATPEFARLCGSLSQMLRETAR